MDAEPWILLQTQSVQALRWMRRLCIVQCFDKRLMKDITNRNKRPQWCHDDVGNRRKNK